MDETYIKIKGQWNYLYRAIDDQGLTLDFQLRKKRDFNSDYHFLKRLLKTYGLPHRLVTDQYGETLKAIKKLTREGHLHKGVHQCSKYRNNLIEQDHRFIKRQQVRSSS
jgi:putative transposase